jgi:type IV pilus assembly protein PilB
VVLRILRPDAVRIGLEEPGLRAGQPGDLQQDHPRPNGIFLVTGPTGSGKTTTLYSALDVLNRPDRKIITAEDPVEYNFDGINQCQVRDQIGLTFAGDPPRDAAPGAQHHPRRRDPRPRGRRDRHPGGPDRPPGLLDAAHQRRALGAITRLIDMGVKPFLVASSIQAVMAQRLIRVLCKECKQPDPDPTPSSCGSRHQAEDETGQRLQGRRVRECNNTGYRGRKASSS